MKYFSAFLIILVWLLSTIALTITIFGLVIVLDDFWMKIPNRALKAFD